MPCNFTPAAVIPPGKFHHRGTRVASMYCALLEPVCWRAKLYEMARGLEPGGILQIGCASGVSPHLLDEACAFFGLERNGLVFTRTSPGVF